MLYHLDKTKDKTRRKILMTANGFWNKAVGNIHVVMVYVGVKLRPEHSSSISASFSTASNCMFIFVILRLLGGAREKHLTYHWEIIGV